MILYIHIDIDADIDIDIDADTIRMCDVLSMYDLTQQCISGSNHHQDRCNRELSNPAAGYMVSDHMFVCVLPSKHAQTFLRDTYHIV